MGVIFAVLGIIKIIFLILFYALIVLLSILIVFLVMPIEYRVSVLHDKGQTSYNVVILTLFRLLGFYGSSKEGFHCRFLWYKVSFSEKEVKETTEDVREVVTCSNEKSLKESLEEVADNSIGEKQQSFKEDKSSKVKARLFSKLNNKEKKATDEKKSFDFFKTIKSIFAYPDKDLIFKGAIKIVSDLIMALEPKVLKLHATFGFEEPYTTGQVLAILGLIYPLYRYDVCFYGSEQKFLKLDSNFKGHFSIIKLIVPFVRFVLLKPVRKGIKMILFRLFKK